jgi:hypothetical protein
VAQTTRATKSAHPSKRAKTLRPKGYSTKSATLLRGEALNVEVAEYVLPERPFEHCDPSVDLLGISSALAGTSKAIALLSPCFMNESHGGGGFEHVPGFDVSTAMTSVISPTGPSAIRKAQADVGSGPRPESAIGDDTRAPVPNTSLLPWRCVALLKLRYESGKFGTGTGWFISPRSLATAAHNIVDQYQGKVVEIQIVPGYSMGTAPYGVHKAVSTYWNPAWATSFDPTLDFALIHIADVSQVGFFGYAAANDEGLKRVAAAVEHSNMEAGALLAQTRVLYFIRSTRNGGRAGHPSFGLMEPIASDLAYIPMV